MTPVVETPRLRMRGYTLADLPRFTEMWSDESFVLPMGAQVSSREEACGRLLRYVGHWALRGFGTWGIEEKSSGKLIGEVGLFDYERDMPPDFVGLPEHGWAFAAEARGQGYATEAVRASLDWGVAHFASFKPYAIIAESNAPSLRVAARCGYRERTRTIFKGRPTVMLTLAA